MFYTISCEQIKRISLQFCTALGATLVPMAFATVDEMTNSITAATFASMLILFGKHLK